MLLQLPVEIQRLIILQLDREELMKVRLVCSELSGHATETLFESHTLWCEYLPRPHVLPWQGVRGIMESETLCGLVKCLVLKILVSDSTEDLLEDTNLVISKLPLLPNLSKIHVLPCGYTYRPDTQFRRQYSRYTSNDFSKSIVASLFEATANHNLVSLTFVDFFADDIITPTMTNTLGKLKHLHIQVRGFEDGPERTLLLKHVMPKWLEAAKNLTALELVAYANFEDLNDLDFRDLFFPCLQSFRLEDYLFREDSQFEWIYSHGGTLKSLYISYCAIDTSYDRKWCQVFEQMETRLPRVTILPCVTLYELVHDEGIVIKVPYVNYSYVTIRHNEVWQSRFQARPDGIALQRLEEIVRQRRVATT
ncbi:hypothetical protein K440DRAFT_662133 [Wilcoxina mikolae CBS 423.85]|nr:hypothetical protein K440DRAFT_662133 [Wilcoxina mikolae CBS 423.85]